MEKLMKSLSLAVLIFLATFSALPTSQGADNIRGPHGLYLKKVPSSEVAPGGVRGDFYSSPTAPKSAEKVIFGIEPITVYDFSPATGIWHTNFFVWWRWKGNIDPVLSTYITNSAEASASYEITYTYKDSSGIQKPILNKDGYFYQQASLRMGLSDNFPLKRYPIDAQKLQIRIENSTYAIRDLIYEWDTKDIPLKPDVPITGWETKGIHLDSYLHQYPTDSGNIDAAREYRDFSLLTYSIEVKRPVTHFIFKLLFPLLIIFITVIAVFFLNPRIIKERIALSVSSLLALIFLQDSYSKDLPSVVPVVLMDKIYFVVFACSIIAFIRIIFTSYLIEKYPEKSEIITSAIRLDAAIAIMLASLTVLVVWLLLVV